MKGWAVLVAVFGLDVGTAGLYDGYGYSTDGYILVGVSFLAAAALTWRSPRYAWTCPLVAFAALVGPVGSTMTSAMMWAGVAMAAFNGAERAQALRVLVAAMYGFATLNKMVGPFADGEVIAFHAEMVPYPRLVAWSVIAIEGAFAVAVLLRWRWLVPAIVGFHLPVAVLVADTPHHAFHLFLYGVVAAWAVGYAEAAQATAYAQKEASTCDGDPLPRTVVDSEPWLLTKIIST